MVKERERYLFHHFVFSMLEILRPLQISSLMFYEEDYFLAAQLLKGQKGYNREKAD